MQKIINLGILAHVDAGKTTVTEGFLLHSGVKREMGRVDHGTTTTDSMALERQRGMTIRSATVSFEYENVKINLIDTPGHMDFIAEVERSLSVLDGVVLVISAKEGVQSQTRVIFRKLVSMRIPVILFVNKIDRLGVDTAWLLDNIRTLLTDRTAIMQEVLLAGTKEADIAAYPFTDGPLCDTLIDSDDALMEAFAADEPITPEMAGDALKRCVKEGRLYPVYFGAALHNVGIPSLLNAIITFFDADTENSGPLSALVYKVEWDAAGHKLLYLRMFSGKLAMREKVPLAGQQEPVYVKGLMGLDNGQAKPVACLIAGDAGILLDAPNVCCGDWVGIPTPREGVCAPAAPLLSAGIAPVDSAQRRVLLNALQRLTEEDPFLQMSIHQDTGEISIRIFGALQREILEALLLERFGLQTVFSPLLTRFAEQPKGPAFAQIRIWEARNHHEAGIALAVEPLPTGSGNQYESKVSLGDLEKHYQNGVEDGVWLGLAQGLGHEIVDTKVTFLEMDYSSVTSTPADYRRLAPLVLQKALGEAGLFRLEPWLTYTALCPVEHQKKVMLALTDMRATFDEITYGETEMTVRGEIPLDTCKLFTTELLSMTQGKGIFHTEFLEYRKQ